MGNCKQLIQPHPGVGDINRTPTVRRCKKKIWRDGFCKIHHPEEVAARVKAEKEFEKRKKEDRRLPYILRKHYQHIVEEIKKKYF